MNKGGDIENTGRGPVLCVVLLHTAVSFSLSTVYGFHLNIYSVWCWDHPSAWARAKKKEWKVGGKEMMRKMRRMLGLLSPGSFLSCWPVSDIGYTVKVKHQSANAMDFYKCRLDVPAQLISLLLLLLLMIAMLDIKLSGYLWKWRHSHLIAASNCGIALREYKCRHLLVSCLTLIKTIHCGFKHCVFHEFLLLHFVI